MTSNPPQKSLSTTILDFIQPFWIGGLSGMLATCVIQPVDMIKIVIQLKSEEIALTHSNQKVNFLSACSDINKKEGIKGFYRGYLFSY
jgi:solute carrier family 25 (mitochondrial oxoglutarate transporter), member 11